MRLYSIISPKWREINLLTHPVADLGFSRGGANSQKYYYFSIFFAENCMKMKEFGTLGGRPWRPP